MIIFPYALGDIIALTAAIRDLALPVSVNCKGSELFLGNPYVFPLVPGPDLRIRLYPSNLHIINVIRNQLFPLGPVESGPQYGDLYFPYNPPRVIPDRYWVVIAGGKTDISVKWWPHYQAVVTALPILNWIQAGAKEHFHQPLQGVTNLVGQTTIRGFLDLLYHADGLLSPVTFAMHAFAAIHKGSRPNIVLAGGREPVSHTAYKGAIYLTTEMPCRGCWRDKSHSSEFRTCLHKKGIYAQCMADLLPDLVISQIKAVLD